ncbi:hypothetical protein ECL_00171 [Enterobacter cloacae subsp. cloacae ATCC 13047]|uniref:Uncharacterized protein n=1 Tax=Enterobacter cloacae subsp. cloacae (strain ATCC 13047 / DSM 30054 / NBRC 13535 / NCTC 10005 / WDCM 00083 / NCDC 279-56) TaxID=716541 RepID=A0A0H3CDS4_ENTCC|nr:hypothetical protein ECL_00171 [Enterobacter cloacae subsp. cloacae ATCC 13047]
MIGGKFCLTNERHDGSGQHAKLKNHFSCVVWRKAKTWITLIM